MYRYTICIPTYNRSHLLGRSLSSLENQSFRNFEVIIIDDGSTDDTEITTISYINSSPLNIQYYKKDNGGKHTALNLALEKARGEFFIILDSDDVLLPTALERMNKLWNNIPVEVKEDFCGVLGRCRIIGTNKTVGKSFRVGKTSLSYIDFHYISGPYGDCCECIKTSILNEYRFPVFSGERFMAEAYVTDQIGLRYRLLCADEVFKEVEYLENGLTKNMLTHRLRSIQGTITRFVNLITQVFPNTREDIPYRVKIRIWSNYWRFVFHDKSKKAERIKLKQHGVFSIVGLGVGTLLFLTDSYRLRNGGKL